MSGPKVVSDARQPEYLAGFRREGGEGPRRRTRKYFEHPEARRHRWVRCVAGRSRKLVRYAG